MSDKRAKNGFNFTTVTKMLHNGKVSDSWLEIIVSELLGTTFLMYIGCLGLFTAAGEWRSLPPLQGGLVWGFVVSAIICAFGHLSRAHLNPCVTLCAYLLGHISYLTAALYFVAEIIGASLGMFLLRISVPNKLYQVYNGKAGPCGFCATEIHADLSLPQAFLIEFVATSLLVLVVCSVWDPRNKKINDSTPIKFALLIAVLSIAAGPFTGASMNPVRSFAPAIVNNGWQNHWLYWLAPLSGSAVTTLLYKCIFLRGLDSETSKYSESAEQNSAMLSKNGSASPSPTEAMAQETNGLV